MYHDGVSPAAKSEYTPAAHSEGLAKADARADEGRTLKMAATLCIALAKCSQYECPVTTYSLGATLLTTCAEAEAARAERARSL